MSIQARKQRKMRYNAPIHKRRKMISSHLAEDLMLKYNKRSAPVKKGDTVKIIRGGLKGHIGKVASVDTRKMKISIEGATAAKADKSQVPRPIDPSNVVITHLDLSDPWRSRKIGKGKIKRKRKIKEKKKEKTLEEKEKLEKMKKEEKEKKEETKEEAEKEEEEKEAETKKAVKEKKEEKTEKKEVKEKTEKEEGKKTEKLEPKSETKESKKAETKEESEEVKKRENEESGVKK